MPGTSVEGEIRVKAIIRIGRAAFIVVTILSVVNVIGAAQANAQGIWIDKARLAGLPMSGAAWTSLRSAADQSCGTPNLEDQEDSANVCVMAKALVYARTGSTSYADQVATALRSIVNSGSYGGRALALGRELAAYVIAADLIDLKTYDPSLDSSFRSKIRSLSTTVTTEAGTLIQCHENRPNNWGTHCGASRAAVAAYLGDTAQLARIAQVFKGWLGDRSSYASFKYGDLSWQFNGSTPVGINPQGATKSGHNIDGVLPDDERRAGGFTWPPPKENYVWEALQGAFAQAVILRQAGYDVFTWEDRALLRAVTWLHEQADFPADADDTWQPYVVNYYYGTSFPAESPSRAGKNVGFTDWTHSGAAACSFTLSGTSATAPAAGGGTQVSVTTTSGCSWSATSNVSWVALSSGGGTGNGTVIATIGANTGAARTGTLTVAGKSFTVNQGAATAPPATPSAPTSPAPVAGATGVAATTTLAWACVGASSYTVRLGTSNPPAQVASGVTGTAYSPGTLTANRTYYWQVVAANASGSATGPVWSFSTAAATTTTLPSPWTAADIGSVGVAGSTTYSGGVFVPTGAGVGVTGSADSFHFVRQPLTGKTTIIARLTSLQAGSVQAQAGIMMREGHDGVVAGSAHASLLVRPGGIVRFITRGSTGGSTSTVGSTTQTGAAVWLRLVRSGTSVTASVSGNGSSWRSIGSVSLALTSTSVVGLAVSSSDRTQRAVSWFDNVVVR
jgi:hypothetical protein